MNSIFNRLYSRILRDLIEEKYAEKEEEEQLGFKAESFCTDNIFCLKQIKHQSRNTPDVIKYRNLK